MVERTPANDLFNAALESYRRGDIDEAVSLLRSGFFENVYTSPALLDEEFYPQDMWYPSADCEPRAAREYVARYGRLWRSEVDAIDFLGEVWNDPIVRRELERYLNVSRAILQSRDTSSRTNYIRERQSFVDLTRIRRTQSEIMSRLRESGLRRPVSAPQLATVYLAAHDPAATVEFYRQFLWLEPTRSSRRSGGYAEFDMPGVRLAIHGRDQVGHGDPYGLGEPPHALGWGTLFVLTVRDFDRYLENARDLGVQIVDRELETPGERSFVVKDPSGYLIEIAEEQ